MNRLLYPLARVVVQILVMMLVPRLRISGQQHLSYRGPLILAPNHNSHSDTALVAASVTRPLWIMAMQEIFQNLLKAKIAHFLKAFPIERDSADRSALRFAQELLSRNQALLIFPEGRLSRDEKLGKVQSGAATLALRTGAALIPVGIFGSPNLMPYAKIKPRFTLAPIHIHFGEAVCLADLTELPKREQRHIATSRLEAAMRRAYAIAAK